VIDTLTNPRELHRESKRFEPPTPDSNKRSEKGMYAGKGKHHALVLIPYLIIPAQTKNTSTKRLLRKVDLQLLLNCCDG
jgi:hypothetical protein